MHALLSTIRRFVAQNSSLKLQPDYAKAIQTNDYQPTLFIAIKIENMKCSWQMLVTDWHATTAIRYVSNFNAGF